VGEQDGAGAQRLAVGVLGPFRAVDAPPARGVLALAPAGSPASSLRIWSLFSTVQPIWLATVSASADLPGHEPQGQPFRLVDDGRVERLPRCGQAGIPARPEVLRRRSQDQRPYPRHCRGLILTQ